MLLTKAKPRIQYIDAMRGFTMLLVVYVHIETYSFEYQGGSTFLGEFFQLFRMPLFFFISGFLTYKKDFEWSVLQCWKLTRKKIRISLFPTIIIGLLYTYICLDKDWYSFIHNSSKFGYWFTIALFEMFIVYYVARFVCSKNILLNKIHLFILLSVSICFLLLYRICSFDNNFANITSIISLCKYFHFFVFGMIVSKYKDLFFRVWDNGILMLIILSVFVICLYIKYKFVFWNSFIVICVAGYCGMTLVFSFFRKYQDFFDRKKSIGFILQYIGKHTLDIYLLHYFIIPRNLLGLGRFFLETPNPILEFAVVILLAFLVICGCLIISKIIHLSSTAAKYLLGA